MLAVAGPLLAVMGLLAYGWSVRSLVRGRPWPHRRSLAWTSGTFAAVAAVAGPVAAAAEHDFVAHMAAHLLLGMLAPVLLVLGAPVTLLLRSLPVRAARRLSRVLAGRAARILSEPVVAALLDVGGLWLLYRSGLYSTMHHHAWLRILVHLHLLGAGYLFTVSMVSVDPLPHRRSFRHRGVILILALAAHDILAKDLYARPPAGAGPLEAERGAMLMYYGGDVADVLLAVLLCARWYGLRQPRPAPATPTP